MLSSKKIVVIATLVLVFLVYAMPSQGATFRNRTISDQQFLELCRNGDANGVTRALNAGLSANVKDKDGRSALMYAAAYGNVETVNVLLKAGADKDIEDYDGRKAIDYAQNDTIKDALR